jgi:hypothetical protein
MENQVKYIDEKVVSELTGRALSTLRNDRHVGKGIPYIKIGRSIRYSFKEVCDFMEAHRIQTEQI